MRTKQFNLLLMKIAIILYNLSTTVVNTDLQLLATSGADDDKHEKGETMAGLIDEQIVRNAALMFLAD